MFRGRMLWLLLGLKCRMRSFWGTLQIKGYGNSRSQKRGINLNIGSGIEAKFSLQWLPTLWSSFCSHVASLSLDIDVFQALQLTYIMANILSCRSREENTRETIVNYGSVQSVTISGRQNTTHSIFEKQNRMQMNISLPVVSAGAECLQRAVEGRAASDEEEEDREMREEGQCGLTEVKKHIGRLHGCGKGFASVWHAQHLCSHVRPLQRLIRRDSFFLFFSRCETHAVHQPPSQSEKNVVGALKDSRGRCSWKGQNQEQPEGSRGFEKEKVGETWFQKLS